MTGWKKEFWRYLLLFLAGYCVYLAIEVTFRGYSFRLMGLTGGAAMVILGFRCAAEWESCSCRSRC